MSYTALQLINRSLYLSQIVSRELQNATGAQIEDGLYLLNAMLDFRATDLGLLPYYQQYNFDTTAGSVVGGSYVVNIENLYAVDSITFNIGDVRYPVALMSRTEFFATPRVDNIATLPFSARCERVLGGMNIYFYFEPADTYDFRVWGKFGLDNVTLETDLSTIYDLYYIEYMRYALAEYLCSEYVIPFPSVAAKRLQVMRKKIDYVSPPDLTCKKATYFGTNFGYDWQSVNLIKGWFPY